MKRFAKLRDTATVVLCPAGLGRGVCAAEAPPDMADVLAAAPRSAAQAAPPGSHQRPMPVTARPGPVAHAQRH
jgi:hypothetical protein